jgi:integrase
MARGIHRLRARHLERLGPGKHSDGGNLYLLVKKGGAKSWLFIYTAANGKRREIGLGPVNGVNVQAAREQAAALREALHQGRDPQAERDRLRVAAAPPVTFKAAADEYIASHRAGWKNAAHQQQWPSTLTAYVYPTMGALAVSAVGVAGVLDALKPIWTTKPETASRVRGRIETVLDYAKVRGWRSGENPALWKGNLAHLLPARAKVRRTKHHAAMPYSQVPAFMAALAGQEGVSPLALRFAILTAARTGEVIGAKWSEVDPDAATWTVPADRMKAGREHRVTLNAEALAILADVPRMASDYVFPGLKRGKPLSNMAMLRLLARMEIEGVTVHGFRSSFRDWAAEQTRYQREVIEAALAHTNADKVEAAYLRTDHFEKRKSLLDAWGRFCIGADNVVQLAATAA